MNSRYIDPYVVCPFYSYDETTTVNKIHCQGYKEGVFVQVFFKKREVKKEHKKCYCNNTEGYQNCPLYKGNLQHYEECQDEQIP